MDSEPEWGGESGRVPARGVRLHFSGGEGPGISKAGGKTGVRLS